MVQWPRNPGGEHNYLPYDYESTIVHRDEMAFKKK